MIQITRNKNQRPVLVFILVFFAILLVFIGCSDKSDNIPTVPETINGLLSEGWAAYQDGDYETAVNKFVSTLERNVSPELSIDAYRGLGWSYSRLEKYAQAVTNFNFVISLESVRSGKFPVIAKEGVVATAIPDTQYVDMNGEWQLKTDEWIVSIDDIDSYNARVSQKLGASPAFELEPGTSSINLPKTEISNSAGTGLGTTADNSLVFSPDSFVNSVESAEALSNLNDFYVDTQKGVLTILPRINFLENIEASFYYHEKGYLIDRFNFQNIVLNEELEDLTDTPDDEVGDVYYLKGDFYNKYSADDVKTGGTYIQADAYAGMSAAFLAQGDYASALEAGRALMYINQDLKTLDAANYPYKRSLYESDNELDLWDFYKILAICYFNNNDYLSAEECLEVYMGQGLDAIDNSTTSFAVQLLTAINSLPEEAPANWSPVDLF